MAGHYWPTPAESRDVRAQVPKKNRQRRSRDQHQAKPAPEHPSVPEQPNGAHAMVKDASKTLGSPESDLQKIQGVNITRDSYHSHEFTSKSFRSFEANLKKFATCQPEPLLVSSKEVYLENAPCTARDLRSYTKMVELDCMYGLPSPEGQINNGKVNTSKYGSIGTKDLGLCYETFLTLKACKHGRACSWRHNFLTKDEREWILLLGGNCVQWMARCWYSEGVPELVTLFPICK